jgi:large subunit ribosomal protein L18
MGMNKMDRSKKKMRTRKKIRGTAERPRLAVFRSTKHIYAQVIDDDGRRTLVSASSLVKDLGAKEEEGGKVEVASRVGKLLAERCKSMGIEKVVFDRGGFVYHGRVAKLAEGARKGGLDF